MEFGYDDAVLHFIPDEHVEGSHRDVNVYPSTHNDVNKEISALSKLTPNTPSVSPVVRVRISSKMKGKQPMQPYTTPIQAILNKLDAPSSPIARVSATKESAPKPRLPKKSRKRKDVRAEDGPEATTSTTSNISDEELNNKMRDSIIENRALHLRVLRFEPIDFDTFFQIAETFNIPTRGLKIRVRNFLDSQAIHFYGYDPSGARTKKRGRHP